MSLNPKTGLAFEVEFKSFIGMDYFNLIVRGRETDMRGNSNRVMDAKMGLCLKQLLCFHTPITDCC